MTTHIPAVKEALGERRTMFAPHVSRNSYNAKSGRWLKILTKCLGTVWFEVPIGYQDETGFHYGEAPVRTQIRYCGDC